MALVLSLGITVVLAVSAVTVISSATSNTREASTHVARNAVEELALAGINDAAALLSLPSKNALNPSIFCLTLQTPPCSQTVSLGGGTVTFSGYLTGTTWTITSTATLPNKNGMNTGNLTKTMTAQIPVIATLTQPLNNPAWNYVYSTHPVTPGVCDMTIQQSVVVASPLIVTVIDEHGRDMGGATVTWRIVGGDGSLSAASTTTDGNGQASVLYTAGNTVGTSTIEADVAGADGTLLVDFNITVVAATDGS